MAYMLYFLSIFVVVTGTGMLYSFYSAFCLSPHATKKELTLTQLYQYSISPELDGYLSSQSPNISIIVSQLALRAISKPAFHQHSLISPRMSQMATPGRG